jgi:hypothetical protein
MIPKFLWALTQKYLSSFSTCKNRAEKGRRMKTSCANNIPSTTSVWSNEFQCERSTYTHACYAGCPLAGAVRERSRNFECLVYFLFLGKERLSFINRINNNILLQQQQDLIIQSNVPTSKNLFLLFSGFARWEVNSVELFL